VLRQVELLDKIKKYESSLDEIALNKAYVFSMKAHGSQKRASGDPYFSHPLEVAGILADLKFDSNTIITALLHDVVEDTSCNLSDITKNFGIEISNLVDGVTKLSKLEGRSERFNQAENFRKLLLATSDDVRVLFVKLADRLHNMRTIHFIANEKKRKRIANETLEIYSPIAERMGMQEIRSELEELCFQILEPNIRNSIIQRLILLRSQDENILKKTVKKLKQLLQKYKIKSSISGREKKPFSIWKKMQIKAVNFAQLSDIMAFKILIENVKDCYSVLGILHSEYSYVPGRFKDYISTPKTNGYKSIHTTLIGPLNRKIEVQIKTFEMDREADYGVAAHWMYKDKIKTKDGKQFKWIRNILDILDQSSEPEEFLEHTKLQMFSDQVFVFTPNGDLISLPKGAMPIDFAFSVHSDIGLKCKSVFINNSEKPLNTILNNGDQVEIICAKKNCVSPEWLNLCTTGKAKACIKRFIHNKESDEFIKLGKEILKNSFKNAKLNFREKNLLNILEKFNVKDYKELFVKIGSGNLVASEVIDAMFPDKSIIQDDKKIILLNKVKEKIEKKSNTVLIKGLTPGMSIHLSKCCKPIPGDLVKGLILSGKGLIVHQADCIEIMKKNKEIIDISWEKMNINKPSFIAKIEVTIKNNIGSLGHLSTNIGKTNSNIRNLKITERTDIYFKINVEIDVQDVKHLKSILATLRTSSNIINIKRIR